MPFNSDIFFVVQACPTSGRGECVESKQLELQERNTTTTPTKYGKKTQRFGYATAFSHRLNNKYIIQLCNYSPNGRHVFKNKIKQRFFSLSDINTTIFLFDRDMSIWFDKK